MKFERTCIACRKKDINSNFVKIVLNKNGVIAVENEKKLNGRGAYLCNTKECFLKCKNTKALNRTFKTAISQEFYEELLQKFGYK